MRNPFEHIYRVRNGKLLGVCGGLARHLGVSADMFRILYVIFTFVTGFGLGLGLYFVFALLMKQEPADATYYSQRSSSYTQSASSASPSDERYYSDIEKKAKINDIITRSERLSKRIQQMEQKVTKDDISWEQRLGNKV